MVMYRFEMFAATHRGRVRRRNEDAFWFDRDHAVAVVADGMGGHPGGADASALAVEAFSTWFVGQVESPSPLDLGDTMSDSVERAHRRIRQAVEEDRTLDGMGTTLTAVAFEGFSGLAVAQVGDSRAYRLRGAELTMLTEDQTWVTEAVAAGRLAPSAAATHPLSHVLSQAVGVDLAPTPAIDRFDVCDGDTYLLCSDGLTGPVSDADIGRILRAPDTSDDLDQTSAALIQAALDGGGPDNVTVVLIRVSH